MGNVTFNSLVISFYLHCLPTIADASKTSYNTCCIYKIVQKCEVTFYQGDAKIDARPELRNHFIKKC
jgi:hypothetical protein